MREPHNSSNPPSAQDIMRLAASPEGQKLLRHLQQHDSPALKDAMNSLSSGNMTQAQKSISSLLNDPQIRQLLSQLGGRHE